MLQTPLRKIHTTEEPKEIDQMGKEKVFNLEIILYLQFMSMKSCAYWKKKKIKFKVLFLPLAEELTSWETCHSFSVICLR